MTTDHAHLLAIVASFLYLVATILVANSPASVLLHPTWGPIFAVLHRFSGARFYDEPGSLKLPGATYQGPLPPPQPSQAGFVGTELLLSMLALLVLLALGGALACHPQLPPVSGCTPGATSCDHDAKMLCSATQRWEPAGDETCAAQHRVCAMVDGGAHCVVATDGGADAHE